MTSLAQYLVAYQTALDQIPAEKTDDFPARLMAAILARDTLAKALVQSQATPADLSAVADLDKRLRTDAPRIARLAGGPVLASWRDAVQPSASSWWWRLDEVAAEAEKAGPIWTVMAVFFLTVSISLTADIARRFLAAGPDFVGVMSTVFQVFFTFLAGRSLTEAGVRSLEKALARVNVKRRYAYIINACLALIVMLAVLGLRLSLPAIAHAYNNMAVRQQQSGDVSAAIQNYQRALSLSPLYAQAHYNLATAYEQSLTYDLAISSYQAALRTDSRNIPAYNNLARVYMVWQSKYSNALTLLNIALDMKLDVAEPDATILRYSLYKNRAWANLGLGYLRQAENDARAALQLRPEGAAAHCLLAQVLDANKQTTAALSEWELCLAYEKLDTFVPVEAAWVGQAIERLSKEGVK